MFAIFVFSILLMTSLLGLLLMQRSHRGLAIPMKVAITCLSECLGLSIIFFVANILCGVGLVILLRLVSLGFVSIYLTSDGTIAVLSLFQGMAFHTFVRR